MKKKWSAVAAILIFSVLLCACAAEKIPSDTADNISKDGKKSEEKAYQRNLDMIQPQAYSNVEGLTAEPGAYLSIIGKSADGQYWEAIKKGAEQAVADINKELGYEGKDKIKVTYSGPSMANDVDEQVNILDEELARYPIAMAISIVDAKACEVQFDLAAESDIPVIAFDSGSDYQGLMSTVATDNDSSARAVADKLAESMKELGEVVIFAQDSKSKAALERESSFKDQMTTQHPEIKIVATYYMDQFSQIQKQIADEINAGTYKKDNKDSTDQPADDAAEVTAESITEEDAVNYIFAKHPNMKACYGTSGAATMLAVNGIERLEKEAITVMGYDAEKEQIEALSAGKIDGLVVQNPFGMGYAAMVASVRASMESGNEAVVNTGYTWVTKENLKDKTVQSILY